MADIVAGAQIVRAEIRLAVRINMNRAVGGQLIFIGVEHVGMVRVDGFRNPPERIRRKHIVVVAQGDILPRRHFNRAVRVAGYARVFRPKRDAESAVPHGNCLQRLSRLGGRAAAIVQAGFPRAVRLGKQRIRQRAEEFRARVEHGDDDADAHIREGVRALGRQFALGCFLPPESPFVPQQHPCRQHFTRAVQRVPRAMHPHIRPNPFRPLHARPSRRLSCPHHTMRRGFCKAPGDFLPIRNNFRKTA